MPAGASSVGSPTSLPSLKEKSNRAQPLSDTGEPAPGRAAGKQALMAVLILKLL